MATQCVTAQIEEHPWIEPTASSRKLGAAGTDSYPA